jgi:hypothetical protein
MKKVIRDFLRSCPGNVAIQVEDDFPSFYNEYLFRTKQVDSVRVHANAEALWLDILAVPEESQLKHEARIRQDGRLTSLDETALVSIIRLLWRLRIQNDTSSVSLSEHICTGQEGQHTLLGSLIEGKPALLTAPNIILKQMDKTSVSQQLKYFTKRRYMHRRGKQTAQLICSYVNEYLDTLTGGATREDSADAESVRDAWRLTLLRLLSMNAVDQGWKEGTTIQDFILIPDLVHLCQLAEVNLSYATTMVPQDAKRALRKATVKLGLKEAAAPRTAQSKVMRPTQKVDPVRRAEDRAGRHS